MKTIAVILTAVLLLTAHSLPVSALISGGVVCWESDIEFPVPCEDDDSD